MRSIGSAISIFLGIDKGDRLERDESDKVVLYTKSIINREDLIRDILDKYQQAKKLDGESRLTLTIQIYLALEQFIINNKPMVVQRVLTKEGLREEIRNSLKMENLPEGFRLIFLPEQEQLLYFYKQYTQYLVEYIIIQAGTLHLQRIIDAIAGENGLTSITLTSDGINVEQLSRDMTAVSAEQIAAYFKQLYSVLYTEIASSFGQKSADDILQKTYQLVKDRYDYDLISQYIKIIPDGKLDRERIAYMTREDLEQQANLAAGERIRREVAEKSATELQQTVDELRKSQATVLHLLTESQDLEKDLRTERDRVNAIISSMNEGLFVVDIEAKITLINHSASVILHTPVDSSLGKNFQEIFPLFHDDKIVEKEETPLWKTLRTGKTITADIGENYYYSHSSGLKFPIMLSSSPLYDSAGTIIGAVFVFRDISETLKYEQTLKNEKTVIEQKVAEQTYEIKQEKEAFQKSEAKLLASIKSITIGFILTDTADKVVAINTAAKNILQISQETVSIVDIDQRLQNGFGLKAKIEQCKTEKKPLELKEWETEDRIFHIVVTPIFTSEPTQDHIGTVIIIDDITEAKSLERTKDEFFAIASHDLRTPLTAIRGYISLIETYFADKISDNDIAQMLHNIDQSSTRLIEIVNEFLNVSRLEQGRLTFNKEVFNLNDLASDVVKEVGNLAEKKHLYLKVENKNGSAMPVLADKEKTKEVMTNLLGNAMKFTEDGGITISLEAKDGSVLVRVSDTGKGVPLHFQKMLFKKFQLAGSSAYVRDISQGSGLGLYISKKLVENMGGNISLESSEENKGSTFLFNLPAGHAQS